MCLPIIPQSIRKKLSLSLGDFRIPRKSRIRLLQSLVDYRRLQLIYNPLINNRRNPHSQVSKTIALMESFHELIAPVDRSAGRNDS